MPYLSDRAFTDYVHHHLALPQIYAALGWWPMKLEAAEAKSLDMEEGIDYVFTNPGDEHISIQERFREVKYKAYTDFTIRYRRDGNSHAARHESEYYKMKADYFLYGITNGTKENSAGISCFEKFAMIKMQAVYQKIDRGEIIIQDDGTNFCRLVDGKIICPVKYNRDQSSSFFPIDINYLVNLWPDLIIAQKGFQD